MSVTLSLARQHKYMWVLLLVNSIMAYSANLLNFLVTKHTSALTLQVLGNAKERLRRKLSPPVPSLFFHGSSSEATLLSSPLFRLMASSRPRLFSHSLCPSTSHVTPPRSPLQTHPEMRSHQGPLCHPPWTLILSMKSSTSKDYSSEHIQVLEGLDPVRKDLGCILGALDLVVYEILDNAIDEAQAGFASKIDVVLHADGSVNTTDLHPATRKSSLRLSLTVLHAGGKFGGKSSGYSVSGGLHGVGLSVVNALSEALEVIVRRDGWSSSISLSWKAHNNTYLSCPPTRVKGYSRDMHQYSQLQFSLTITLLLEELGACFPNPKVTISLKKEDDDPERDLYSEYFYAGEPLHDVLGFRKEINGTTVDVALQWCSDAYSDTMLGYANSIRTIDGGTHIEGVKASLTRTLNSLAKKLKEKDISLSGEHRGLTCIVSVKVPDPEFEGQTKTRLGNPEVRKIVDQSLQEYLTEYLELHPDAALAAKRARELVRSKSILKSSSLPLPGKLADCSSTDPASKEIQLVAAQNRVVTGVSQAILPLRGKILNIERKDEAAMYKNEEIQNLILGLGLGVKGEDFNMENLRYHKIIILTDADVDGAHIRTLLLTFFFRYQRALFDAGCIYVVFHLFSRLRGGNRRITAMTRRLLNKLSLRSLEMHHTTFRGSKVWGEMMPEQLWETTMNPDTRILKQLVVDVRKELIKSAATRINVEHLDI
ncbi:LOW QUALITY PROTEIN: hypothetical protein HID58_020409 [Brassica napus]|uniref:DNA topoisomerase 2 n=1 Tax=Brassica napus TaxID=3708 RepID=A0ABQ7XJL7_BRANA|nr:LOW QUALITY PROTEIN: hypothetical protein HID58_020409 [Brassica napus]